MIHQLPGFIMMSPSVLDLSERSLFQSDALTFSKAMVQVPGRNMHSLIDPTHESDQDALAL